MRIVLYGPPLGDGGYLTELPFLLNGKIERIYKDASELQDLEADIAIANFSRPPEYTNTPHGWNWLRLPKVKVQLAIQAEHWDEYAPWFVPGITHNFDGSICYPFNRKFWDFDDSYHSCFSRSYWIEHNIPIKPVFYFDPMVLWNDFYQGPLTQFENYGYMVGSVTIHRDRIKNSNALKYRCMHGDMRKINIQTELKKSGIAWNIHKFQLRGKCPETDGKEIKHIPKTEAIKLAYFYNLGMAVISEKLDDSFPERFSVIETDDIDKYDIQNEMLLQQTLNNHKTLTTYHDLNTELNNLIESIKKGN